MNIDKVLEIFMGFFGGDKNEITNFISVMQNEMKNFVQIVAEIKTELRTHTEELKSIDRNINSTKSEQQHVNKTLDELHETSTTNANKIENLQKFEAETRSVHNIFYTIFTVFGLGIVSGALWLSHNTIQARTNIENLNERMNAHRDTQMNAKP